MSAKRAKGLLVCGVACMLSAQIGSAQEAQPLVPIWERLEDYGAHSSLMSQDRGTPKIAFDASASKLYRILNHASDHLTLHSFLEDGSDSGNPDIVVDGLPGFQENNDYSINTATRLSVRNDTIIALTRSYHQLWLSGSEQHRNIMDCRFGDGTDIRLYGSGTVAMHDAHLDWNGTLVLVQDELRAFDVMGWPRDTIAAPGAERFAIAGDRIVLGNPSAFMVLNRHTLNPVDTISLGGPDYWKAACFGFGDSEFYYVAYVPAYQIRVGRYHLENGAVWDTTITLETNVQPTAAHVDIHGKLWIGLTSGYSGGGRLIEFSPEGLYLGYFAFRQSVHDITSSASHLYLSGISGPTSWGTYVAAFGIDLFSDVPVIAESVTRIYPNPANEHLQVTGLAPCTKHLTITDATGRFVRELKGPFANAMSVPVADLPNGTYLLSLSVGGARTSKSFSVLH